MKKAILVLMILVTLPALGEVRLGVRGGLTVGELRFDRDVINSDNRVGYTGGLLLDVGIPVVGLGIEASVMYTHRDNRLTDQERIFKRHYIDIPLMVRYKMSLAGIKRVLEPMVFTGPSISILFDENAPSNYDNSKTYLSWDIGAGVELFRHLRVTAAYGLGMSRAMKCIDREYTGDKVNGKDRYWTVSAAWLF